MIKLTSRKLNGFWIISLVLSILSFAAMEWNRYTLPPYRTFVIPGDFVNSIVSPDGKYLAATHHVPDTGLDRYGHTILTVTVWDINKNKKIYSDRVPESGPYSPAFSEDGKSLLFENGVAALRYNLDSREPAPIKSSWITGITLARSQDGKSELIDRVSGDKNRGLFIRSTETGKAFRVQGKADRINFRRASFTPDGNILHASDVSAGITKFWNTRDGKQTTTPEWVPTRPHRLRDLRLFDDGKKIATAWSDQRIVLSTFAENEREKREETTLIFPGDNISWIYLRDDGRFLVARGCTYQYLSQTKVNTWPGGKPSDPSVKYDWYQVVWDLETGRSYNIADGEDISPQGVLLKSPMHIRDLRTGQERRLSSGSGKDPSRVKFVGRRDLLMGSSFNHDKPGRSSQTVYIWKVPPR